MIEINKTIVETIIKEQFLQWATLAIKPIATSGWDNRTFHLGDDMSVRLPSAECYVAQVEKEWFWLPKLQAQLSFPISTPLAKGEPSTVYPFPFLINQWVKGDTVTYNNINNLNQFALDLAAYINELQAIDCSDGPVAGLHNFYRGGELSVYDKETVQALADLSAQLPVEVLAEIWQVALQSHWLAQPVWVHGDIAVGNLLVQNGRICAIIDFGVLGVGDPACDYAIAWTFLDADSRKVFYDALACDKKTWQRARGWALWKALITYNDVDPVRATNADYVIKEILAEYANDEIF